MKTRIAVITAVLAFAGVVLAVTLTIDIPANDVPRVQEAFGSMLGLGRPANQAEVTRAVTQWIHDSTKDYERRKNQAQFTPPPLEMQPSPSPTPTAGGLMQSTGAGTYTNVMPTPQPTPTPKKKK